MALAAYLHGDPGRLPFIGHFRSTWHGEGVDMAVAGSVASRADVSTAFRAARTIETSLSNLQSTVYNDRHELLHAAWEAIIQIEGCDLGPQSGADLSVLFAVSDHLGLGIAGVGLAGVWSWNDDNIQPLAVGKHPLLGVPGRPERLPGILTLDCNPTRFVATAHDHTVAAPNLADIKVRCGVHP